MSRVLVIPLFLTIALTVPAEEKAKPEVWARTIAPFLDEQTIAVVRVDLSRIDSQALINKIGELGKLDAEDLAQVRLALPLVYKSLTATGAREVYVMLSLSNVPYEPFVIVVPLPQGADSAAIVQILRPLVSGHNSEVEKIGSAVVAGHRSTLKRLRNLQPAELPELAQAFAAASDTSVQGVVLMPQTLRRAFEETMPKLPPDACGGSIKTVTRGFRWAAVGADLTPKLSLQLTVQAEDAEAARALDKLLDAVFQAIRKTEKGNKVLDQMLQLLRPKVNGDRLTLNLGDKELSGALVPLISKVGNNSRRDQSMNNLKQIALALHNYWDTHKTFPAHASYDKQGRPLLSWRVQILPYVDQNQLYKQFRLDEPWDSEHNKKLITRMPAVFRDPLSKTGPGKTTYLAPVGKDLMFPPGPNGIRIQDVTDGTSNTIFIVEVDDKQAVQWTKPEDLKVDLQQPLRGLAGADRGWFLAAFADGSVHVLQRTIDPATLRGLFTRNGGEVLNLP